MMFNPEHITLDMKGVTQKDVLRELADLANRLGRVTRADKLVENYLQREKESTTGFGNGIAIPHTKSDNVLQPTILFGRTKNAIDWNSLDGKAVQTVISLLVPLKESAVHLKLLAKLSRQLVHPDFVHTLKEGSKEKVYILIKQTIGE